jgi:type I restriction enzyme S subunit
MICNERKFGDFFRVKHGYAFKSEFFAGNGDYIVLTPGNFFDEGGFKDKGNKEKFYAGSIPKGFVLNKGDLLVAMTEQAEGLLGSSAIVPESDRYLHNQRLGLITELDEEKLDKRFLYYLFNTRDVRNQIRASASGAKIRHTAPERILGVRFRYLPIEAQHRIASILSAYDDLIENNTRRIAILEEMARRIYEEWFVHFRFPGHEKVRMVESELGLIPEGWEIKTLGELAADIRQGIQPTDVDPQTPYVGLEHIPRRSITLNNWGNAQDVQSTKLTFNTGDILFGKIRPYFHKVAVAPVNGVTSSDSIVIRPKHADFYSLVLVTVSSDAFVAHATQTSNGTKMPRANWNILVKYPVMLPPTELLRKFNSIVSDVVAITRNFILRNQNLRTTRDLLLPKLISGEIDISKLPEPNNNSL